MNIQKLIDEYIVEEISFINGDESTNILNKIPIFIINLKKDIYRRNYIITLFDELKINFKLIIIGSLFSTFGSLLSTFSL